MKNLIVVRGGGYTATGTIVCLHNAGYRVLVLETEHPSALRREVSFTDAVYDGIKTVERVTCQRVEKLRDAEKLLKRGEVVMLVDPEGQYIHSFGPQVVIDAVMTGNTIGTAMEMANFTIGLGPGFCAGRDVSCVIETMRGHNLGRIIYEGYAMRKDGVPGIVDTMACDQVVIAPVDGQVEPLRTISFMVHKGDAIVNIHQPDGTVLEVEAPLDGTLRGILHRGHHVKAGARIAGSVLEAVMAWERGTRR